MSGIYSGVQTRIKGVIALPNFVSVKIIRQILLKSMLLVETKFLFYLFETFMYMSYIWQEHIKNMYQLHSKMFIRYSLVYWRWHML